MIQVFGTVCIDHLQRVPRLPEPGGYVEIEDETTMLGGEAANTALALQTWGAEVQLYANAPGQDVQADVLRRLMLQKGLREHSTSIRAAKRTPVCEIYVTPDGDRTMFGLGFREMRHSIDFEGIEMAPGEWFTVEPNMAEVAREAATRAAKAGMHVYLMDFVHADDPIIAGGYWQSSTDWAGKRNDPAQNERWVSNWIERFGCFTILTDGPHGFYAGSPKEAVRHYPPYPCPEIVDTTGAGDVFRAGALFGLNQSWPSGRFLQYASAAGCLKCRHLGGTSGVPSRDEIQALIGANPAISRKYE